MFIIYHKSLTQYKLCISVGCMPRLPHVTDTTFFTIRMLYSRILGTLHFQLRHIWFWLLIAWRVTLVRVETSWMHVMCYRTILNIFGRSIQPWHTPTRILWHAFISNTNKYLLHCWHCFYIWFALAVNYLFANISFQGCKVLDGV